MDAAHRRGSAAGGRTAKLQYFPAAGDPCGLADAPGGQPDRAAPAGDHLRGQGSVCPPGRPGTRPAACRPCAGGDGGLLPGRFGGLPQRQGGTAQGVRRAQPCDPQRGQGGPHRLQRGGQIHLYETAGGADEAVGRHGLPAWTVSAGRPAGGPFPRGLDGLPEPRRYVHQGFDRKGHRLRDGGPGRSRCGRPHRPAARAFPSVRPAGPGRPPALGRADAPGQPGHRGSAGPGHPAAGRAHRQPGYCHPKGDHAHP